AVDARARTGREGARVVRTCGHTGEAEVPKDGLRRQSDDGRVIADLAIAVWAPAVPDPPGRDAARMERAAADEAELETPLHEGGYGPGVCCIVAEPTAVGAPTIRGAGRRHRARVDVPCVEFGERDTGGSSDPDGGRAVGEPAVAEAPEFVSPPAIRIAGRCDRAGVLPAGSDGLESDARRGLDQSGDIPNGLGVVAELAATVESP